MTLNNNTTFTKSIKALFELLVHRKYFGKFPEPTLLNHMKSDMQKEFPFITEIKVSYNFNEGHFLLSFRVDNTNFTIPEKTHPFTNPYFSDL